MILARLTLKKIYDETSKAFRGVIVGISIWNTFQFGFFQFGTHFNLVSKQTNSILDKKQVLFQNLSRLGL